MTLITVGDREPAEGSTVTPLGAGALPAELPLRASLRRLTSYAAPQPVVPVRLNTNEMPYPPSPELVSDIAEAVRIAATTSHRYPDPHALALRTELADYLTRSIGCAMAPANVWVANGSSEILQQLMALFGGAGRCALGCTPAYSMYRILAECFDTEWISVPSVPDFALDVDDIVAAITDHRPDLVFVTNPHSPSGHSTEIDELERILNAAPGIVVVDEAYGEFSATPSAIRLIERFPTKLVVTRTLSKAFGFAGGRLGYLIAAPAVVETTSLVRLPYHLSAITQAAARAVLRHSDTILARVATTIAERGRLCAALRTLGFEVHDSEANFLLFGRFADPSKAWQNYLDRGVLIREVGTQHHLRVTIGSTAENERFLAVCSELRELGMP
ncbi:histidinol-phosphate transaminase [Nocardia sp. NBC_01009]|uniref:histidinol-phosphate transaminase n=1 Tax=Nocardia sp. NBC_01009 TaxID=2975996 RepID=UPI00386CD53F|nr:histidinol-phosphate transaminase [Nocardia sp. NBC_01009]